MTISSVFKQSLLAVCLVSLGFAGCSKEKEPDKAADKKTPIADKTDNADKADPDKTEKDTVPPTTEASAALAYLPNDCSIAMHANLKALAANPVINTHVMPALREALAAGQKKKKEFADFMSATGLDPFADFHELSICAGALPSGTEDPKGIITVTGDINNGIIEKIVKNSDELDDSKIVDIKGQKSIDDDGALVTQMADGSLSGGNHKELLVASIDKPNAFAADFKSIGNAEFRIVVPAKTVTKSLGMPGSPFTQFATKIAGATTVALDLANTTLTVKIATVDESSANEIAGMAKLLLGQVPKGGPGPQGAMMTALAAAKTSGEGNRFVMTMQLPAEQFEMASKMLAETIRANISEDVK